MGSKEIVTEASGKTKEALDSFCLGKGKALSGGVLEVSLNVGTEKSTRK